MNGLAVILIIIALISCTRAEGRWGTFRPGIYAGVKATVPQSPLFGVMFNDAMRRDGFDHIRHDCDDRDQMQGFGYAFHDGFHAGTQFLPDRFTGVNLTTSFLEHTDENGSGWVMRISGDKLSPSSSLSTLNLVWYFTLESPQHSLFNSRQNDGQYTRYFKGDFGELGMYEMGVVSVNNTHPRIPYGHRNKPRELSSAMTSSAALPAGKFWDVKSHLRSALRSSLDITLNQRIRALETHYRLEEQAQRLLSGPAVKPSKPPTRAELEKEVLDEDDVIMLLDDQVEDGATVVYAQHVINVPFQLDIVCIPLQKPDYRSPLLDPQFVTAELRKAKQKFENDFESRFGLVAKEQYSPVEIDAARKSLASLIGSTGHFHGKSIEISRNTGKIEWAGPFSLKAIAPARSFFPRGFLWDEGFHQLLVSQFNVTQSLEILKSWIDLIHEDGWLPREQILGEEARARVPAEFQPQHPNVANPPTLFLALERIIALSSKTESRMFTSQDLQASQEISVPSEEVITFLKSSYTRLMANFAWMLQTQAGMRENSFRWKECTRGHCLASGLDDLPRPEPELEQNHVDLHSWMAYMAGAMSRISTLVEQTENAVKFKKMSEVFTKSLDQYHWDSNQKMYVDSYLVPGSVNGFAFSNHIGYNSLLPFCLGLIPASSPKLLNVLETLADESVFWTPYGITSLSMKDELFGKGENYWRGPIWINVNYLIVSALYRYGYTEPGPHQEKAKEVYKKLRENVTRNILKEFDRTGYLWEQYNPRTGQGQRSHPFTGWTSLVVLMMSESY